MTPSLETAEVLPRRFGEYLLLEALATGGTGRLHLAQRVDAVEPLMPLVIKRLQAPLLSDPESLARFRHEADIAVSIDSPHVVRVHDVGAVQNVPYLAMEYLLGHTLGEVVGANGGPRPALPMLSRVFGDALRGLAALHSATHPETQVPLGAVHRDVSPRNVLIGADDGRTILIDFGIGRSNVQEWRTKAGVVMGTPGYMAPEQARGERLDHRADLYSIGVLLWEALTGRHYVEPGPLPMMLAAMVRPAVEGPAPMAELPSALEAVVHRALQPRPADRFEGAEAFLEALEAAVPPCSRATVLAELPAALVARSDVRRAHMSALLSADPTPLERSDAPTEIFARRPTASTLRPAPDTMPMAVAPDPSADAEGSLTPRTSERARRPGRGAIPRTVAAAFVVASVMFVGSLLSMREPTPVSIEPQPGATPARPSAVPRETPRERVAEPGVAEERVEAPPPVPTPVRRRDRVRKSSPERRERRTPQAELESLLRECARLRKERPELAASIDRIVTDASLWRRSADDRIAAALPGLRRRLRALDDGRTGR